MMDSDNISLRLNEFEANVISFWNELRTENDFCDVILASEEKQIKTHKMVISSCSPVFKNILKMNENSIPLIYLRKVKFMDLQNLVTFMYQGEVNVARDDLNSFLEAAEDLKIRGLSERRNEGAVSETDNYQLSQHLLPFPRRKIPAINNSKDTPEVEFEIPEIFQESNNDYDCNNVFQLSQKSQMQSSSTVKSEVNNQLFSERKFEGARSEKNNCQPSPYLPPLAKRKIAATNKRIGTPEVSSFGIPQIYEESTNNSNYNNYSQLSQESHIKSTSAGKSKENDQSSISTRTDISHEYVQEGIHFSCDQCDFIARRKQNLKVHINSVHKKRLWKCRKCDKKFSAHSGLSRHKKSAHEGVRYPCEYCDYKGTDSGNLKKHKFKHHQHQ